MKTMLWGLALTLALTGCKKKEEEKKAPTPAPGSATAPAPTPGTATAPAPTPTTGTAPAPMPATDTAPTPAPGTDTAPAPAPGTMGGDMGGDMGGGAGEKMSAAEEKEAMAFMEKTADEICACKDQACVEGVMKKMMEAGQKWGNKQPSPEAIQKMQPIMEKMQGCMAKMMGGGGMPQ